jgi:preprotein translocase subunit Sss1
MEQQKTSVIDLIRKSIFIIKRTENPDPEEMRKVARITASFMLILGLIGILTSLVLNIVK